MSRHTEAFEVDGVPYTVTQYSAGKGVRLLAKLVKMAGKSVGILTGGGMDSDITAKTIGDALEALAANVEPEDFERLCREVLEGTMIQPEDGKTRPIVFDTDFSGKVGHLFKVLKAVLSFQYADFLGGLAAVTPVLAAKATGTGRVKAL